MNPADSQTDTSENVRPVSTDLDLFERMRGGDEEAFSSLFRAYYEPLYQFAGRYTRDAQNAESLVQDVFVKIWEHREGLRVRSNVKSYLYTAVRNHALNMIKREGRMSGEESFDLHEGAERSPEEALIDKETAEAVRRAVENLAPQCRQVYTLKRYDHLSYVEIAEVLNVTVNTVKTQMKRAIKSLKKQLAGWVTSLISRMV